MQPHQLPAESKAVLSVGAALSAIKYEDTELARFDRLQEYIGNHGGHLKSASEAMGEQVTCQVMAIVATGYVYNWYNGGDEAALTLPAFDDFMNEVSDTDSKYYGLVRLSADILRNIAWMEMGDRNRRAKIGQSMLDLLTALLEADPDCGENAIDLALASRDLLVSVDDPGAQIAQGLLFRTSMNFPRNS